MEDAPSFGNDKLPFWRISYRPPSVVLFRGSTQPSSRAQKFMHSSTSCSCGHTHPNRRDFVRLMGLSALALISERVAFADASSQSPATGATTLPKYHGVFAELPVGAVKPKGWTEKWLLRQATGLTGHPENLSYPYDTCMYAGVIPEPGKGDGSVWWPYEQSGYFIDATARLNGLIDDPGIRARLDKNIDYILAHATDRGYGPFTVGWPNAVVGRALLAEYSATGNAQIVQIMEAYLTTHAAVADREGVNAEEALRLYGVTGNPQLLAYAQKVFENYISQGFMSVDNLDSQAPIYQHGVSTAEMLKILPLYYLYTGDARALELARTAFDKAVGQSSMPDGGIISNEDLETPQFVSLHETCDLSDWTWSAGYQLMATGDAKWADLIERTIFNALPGAVSKDFKQLQYFSCANQILATSLSSHGRYAPTRMSYRAAHEVQCCSGNVNRAMPNFVIRQWMRTPDDGLAAVFYGPSEVTATVRDVPVTITQTTDYPFREQVTFTVKANKPVTFPLQLRIPAWCSAAKITINGTPFTGAVDSGTFATVEREFKEGDVIGLTLPMEVLAEPWYDNKAIAFTRGPLVFSLSPDEKQVEITHDTPQVVRFLGGHDIQGFPALEFYPQSEWRYGVDRHLNFANSGSFAKVVESPMTDNPFLAAEAPVRLEVPLRHMPNWEPHWTADSPADAHGNKPIIKTPQSLPAQDEFAGVAAAETKTLLPYGATYLRLTTLPIIA
jgi:hypothetical protein